MKSQERHNAELHVNSPIYITRKSISPSSGVILTTKTALKVPSIII